jgi:hypothetical protein
MQRVLLNHHEGLVRPVHEPRVVVDPLEDVGDVLERGQVLGHFDYFLGPFAKRLQVTFVLVQVRLIIRLVLVVLVYLLLHVAHKHVNVRVRLQCLLVVYFQRLLTEKVVQQLLSNCFVLLQLL